MTPQTSFLIGAGMPALTCHLRPSDGRLPKTISDAYSDVGEDDFRVELVYYTESTSPSSPWTCTVLVQRKFRGCQNFTSPRPRTYSTWALSLMFGGAYPVSRKQLSTNYPTRAPTLHRYLKGRKFPRCCAHASNESSRKGSNVY